MSRRVSLPGADELFRTTGGTGLQPSSPRRGASAANGETRVPAPASSADGPSASGAPVPTGAASAAGEEHSPAAEEAETAVPRSRGAGADGDIAPSAQPGQAAQSVSAAQGKARPAAAAAPATGAAPRRRGRTANRRPSGRERHDEKITVYVSAEELMDLEHARLVLRGEHGLAVDRGRIVREAVAVVLADLESRGDASILVRRLRGR
ncbi:hypothetical protein V1460_24050 [Streptomyces sp. SCSIO 30461]|uniref:hypothetical protein n=1 Tax=Streptomyces sp. SCSIO 30461 TaxID=3118085 RepID=UPI0030CBC784